MEREFYFHYIVLSQLALAVHVLGQAGYTSIDCGNEQTPYTDVNSQIYYTSDSPYIETGVNKVLPDPSSVPIMQYRTVRSFPSGYRNCYSLERLNSFDTYLVRASFMYGNYDGLNKLPEFDVYLGIDLWFSVKFDNSSHMVWSEIITMPTTTMIAVCLMSKGSGIPFISLLEFRQWPNSNSMYPYFNGRMALMTWKRVDVGSNKALRFPEDRSDRIWAPDSSSDDYSYLKILNSTNDVNGTLYYIEVPSAVMQTAVESNSSDSPIEISWSGNPNSSIHLNMYFSELEQGHNNLRELILYKDGKPWGNPFVPPLYKSFAIYSNAPGLSGQPFYSISIRATNSRLAPLLNAYEVYEIKQLTTTRATLLQDVLAIMDIKRRYAIKKDWMGDPCLPQWVGVNCDIQMSIFPRITAVDLSGNNLTGEISDFFSKLSSITSINLANNSLRGIIPDYFGDLPNLKDLNLEGNQLYGTIPRTLQERAQNGTLTLRFDNQEVTPNTISKNGHTELVVAIVVPTTVSFILLLVVVTLAINLKSISEESLKSDTKGVFTYKEVVVITKDFQSVIGKGGSGTVYHGRLKNHQEVAVKVLNKSQTIGPEEFLTEVTMLTPIHHRYLVSFIGFCKEGGNMILIYEYMPYGNLRDLLSGNNNKLVALTWEQRLRIALTAAQGLEYLHYGCKPPIVHRDVKTANILVNERLDAKIADFGLSKVFPSDSMTHVTTVVGGTHGYLDPEYYRTNKLTEKSDVYSFGTVLLELITGRPAIITVGEERVQIIEWVRPMLESGDIKGIVDPILGGKYDTNCIWKVAEVSLSCLAQTGVMRPTISQVVGEIKEAIDLEMEGLRTKSLNMELRQLQESSNGDSFTLLSAR